MNLLLGWSNTGVMNYGRYQHTASTLRNGKVLVAGGQGTGSVYLNSVELYDPSTEQLTVAQNMTYSRFLYAASTLTNWKALVAGGQITAGVYSNSAKLYDPSTGQWSNTGNMTNLRSYHTASILTNGKVLVAGGFNGIYVNVSELNQS